MRQRLSVDRLDERRLAGVRRYLLVPGLRSSSVSCSTPAVVTNVSDSSTKIATASAPLVPAPRMEHRPPDTGVQIIGVEYGITHGNRDHRKRSASASTTP